MARYIIRKCPKCRDYFGVAVRHPSPKAKVLPLKAYCTLCGYQLKGWRVIVGGKRPTENRWDRLPKVFR